MTRNKSVSLTAAVAAHVAVVGGVVRDTRYAATATLYRIDYSHRGADGYGVVVIYDDEPDALVSTGSDYYYWKG